MAEHPTAELRSAMCKYGLEPPEIQWDGEIHRFPGVDARSKNDTAGWYVAYPDPPEGAAFGCWRTGLDEKWFHKNGAQQSDEFDPKTFRRRIAKQKAEREAKRRAQQQEVAAECRERWAAATKPDPDHPYLVRKGITDLKAGWLKQEGDLLLVPMKSTADGNPIVNLETIAPDGTKLFQAGGQVAGTRATIMTESDTSRLYVCEGWATGWSINHAMGDPVVVSFTAGNLKAVATYLRESYPDSSIIIAADNDRWTQHHSGQPNPGLIFATEAAEAANAELAIPDFPPEALETQPTDFNDLHQIEGQGAVIKWLEPARATESVTVPVTEDVEPAPEEPPTKPPEPEDPEPPDDETPSSGPEWLETARFRILGNNRNTYYFLPVGTGQVIGFSPSQMARKENLYTLAPASWWEAHFPADNGTSWKAAVDALIRVGQARGIYSPEQIRGRGCWIEEAPDADESGVVLHLGRQMVVPGEKRYVAPDEYHSPGGYIYEVQPPKKGPSNKPLTVEEASEVLDVFRAALWSEHASGDMLAGWTVLAPIGGALDWRPHIWITGERGCGKSYLCRELVTPLLADLCLYVVGQTTEAGIRHELKADAFPVVFDEAEEDETAGNRIQRVLALARQASSENDARTLKGTPHGSALEYRVRSMFCLASIGGAIYQESDRSRFNLLQLKGPSQVDPEKKAEHWDMYRPRLEAVTHETGRRLISRTMKLLRSGVLTDTISVFQRAAASVLKDQRMGDQYGTLYAGAWSLQSDEVPTYEVARSQIDSEELDSYHEDQLPEGMKALNILLQQRERVDKSDGGTVTLSVGELIEVSRGEISPIQKTDADRFLGQAGFKVEVEGGSFVLYVANQSEWIRKALQGTIYARGIRTVLRGLKGVEPSDGPVRFSPSILSRATRIPYSLLSQEEW